MSDRLLQEDGFLLLLETGDAILLDDGSQSVTLAETLSVRDSTPSADDGTLITASGTETVRIADTVVAARDLTATPSETLSVRDGTATVTPGILTVTTSETVVTRDVAPNIADSLLQVVLASEAVSVRDGTPTLASEWAVETNGNMVLALVVERQSGVTQVVDSTVTVV